MSKCSKRKEVFIHVLGVKRKICAIALVLSLTYLIFAFKDNAANPLLLRNAWEFRVEMSGREGTVH